MGATATELTANVTRLPWWEQRHNRDWFRQQRPLLLVTSAHPTLLRDHHSPHLGRLIQPRHTSSIEATHASGLPWAADNDCFQGLDVDRYWTMLDRLKPLAETCLFACVPDVVGDAVETARQFERWESGHRRRGLPSALVAQDGLEDMPRWLAGAWPRIDALFMGGTTEWKLGPAARMLAVEAHERGKWVHWGRVNTKKRFDYIVGTGTCDSFDGSKFARWRKTYLDEGLAWCEQAHKPSEALPASQAEWLHVPDEQETLRIIEQAREVVRGIGRS